MRVIIAIGLALASIVACAEGGQGYIAVNASGWVEAVPDQLSLEVSIMQRGKDVAQLQREVDHITQQVVDAARELGVGDGDIDSARIMIQPEYEWRNNQRVYLGQSVQRQVTITLRELERYGELVQALSRYPLDSMGQPRMGYSQLEELQLEALDRALASGQTKAGRIAKSVGATLGPVISVEEAGAVMPSPHPRMLAEMAASGAPEIQFGKQRITASVTMRFAID